MAGFRELTITEIEQIDELLDISNKVLSTPEPIIHGNQQMATAVGTAIGGSAGSAITAQACLIGLSGICGGSLAGIGVIGIAKAGAAVAAGKNPFAIPIAFFKKLRSECVRMVKKVIRKVKKNTKKSNKQEYRKQIQYVIEIIKKQQSIYEKYENLKREHERTDKEKNEIIKKQAEKLAEYEAMFEALKKNREDLEKNLKSVSAEDFE